MLEIHTLTFVAGDPSLTKSISQDELDSLIKVSRAFSLPQLETICMNYREGNYHLNESIAAFVNDETVSNMKEMFLNCPKNSDICFKIEGKTYFYLFYLSQIRFTSGHSLSS